MRLTLNILNKLTIILFCSALNMTAQNVHFDWAHRIGGESTDPYAYDRSYKVFVDKSKNVYSVGTFVGTADLDPGPSIFNLTSNEELNKDIYVSKLDSSGNFIWAKHWGGPGNDNIYGATMDQSENLLVVGNFAPNDSVDFDPGPNEQALTSDGWRNSNFITKLNNSGELIWVKQFEGYATIISVETDGSNNVYVTGTFSDTVDFDPGSGVFNITVPISDDYMFIVKLDSMGDFLWARSVESRRKPNPWPMAVSELGNVYVSGYFQGTADFDPGIDTFNLTAGGEDVFILKLDHEGNFSWAKSFDGPSTNDRAWALSLDDEENLYVAGSFHGTVDFDPSAETFYMTTVPSVSTHSSSDGYVVKLNSSGAFIWAKQFGGNSSCYSSALTIDEEHNVYIAGTFVGTADLDPGTTTQTYTANGLYELDIFMVKLDELGDFIYSMTFGGEEEDRVRDIITDNSNNIYLVGNFRSSVDFDPSNSEHNLTSNAGEDGFILKLTQNPTLLNIHDVNKTESFSFYPNPIVHGNNLWLNNLSHNASIIIYNIEGKIAYSQKEMISGTKGLDISSLEKGNYTIEVITENGETNRKKLVVL